jgi:hypothetical protein
MREKQDIRGVITGITVNAAGGIRYNIEYFNDGVMQDVWVAEWQVDAIGDMSEAGGHIIADAATDSTG